MKPAPFGYHRASSVSDAIALLTAYEGSARVIAGGQSLVPMLNMRLIRPDALVDVNGLADLAHVRPDGDTISLGALVRYTTIERSPLIAARLGLLARVVGHIGDRQVRNRGTIGGSLAHGDPTGEMPLACLVLGATVGVTGPSGRREIPVAGLYEGSYATVLRPDELLTEIIFPPSPSHFAFAEQCRRHNDFAVVSVAAVGDHQPDGTWANVRIGLGGVADQPFLAGSAAVADGSRLSDDSIAEAAEAAVQIADPPSDIRASAEYRRHLVAVYVRRVLTELRSAGSA
ncbi:MAG TPA: xanthine dehydrogenase family protein subunit M [Streptosporangiaceae bacterium]|nr:xanthine dehydrogenase family protein subunit M [Streptosporangiaceae bacterium]